MKAVAVILAAGEGKQFGHAKALLEHESGRSFLRSLALTFAKAGCAAIGVVGHEADKVRAQHPELPMVESPSWNDGPLASARAGVDAALAEGAEVVLLHPVDQPAIRASTLKTLLRELEDAPAGVAPEFEGAVGFPLVLTRAAAEALPAQGGTPLGTLVASLGLKRVPTKDPGVVVNVNTPEIYERLFGAPPHLAPPPRRRSKKAS